MSGERNGIEREDILNDILEERREFEGRLEHQLNRLEQLIGALVNISRMETGMIRLQPETGRIFDTILEAVNGIWVKAQKKNIEIQMDAGDDIEDLMISHDRKWLCEALLNLLDNGVKYSPSGTVITIRELRMTSFLRIEIQDHRGPSRHDFAGHAENEKGTGNGIRHSDSVLVSVRGKVLRFCKAFFLFLKGK